MTDTLRMKNLRFYAYHGELPEERAGGQIFEVEVEVFFDQMPSAVGDDLSKGVDAREIYRRIREIVTGSSCNLVETVAQKVADSLLDLPLIEAATIKLRKPAAQRYDPDEPEYEVEIHRSRD